MPNNRIELQDGTVLIDLSSDTVTQASHIVNGKVGHLADGSIVTGTANNESIKRTDVQNSSGTTCQLTGDELVIEGLSITANGVYTTSGTVDGYSPITVNVSGGGSSSKTAKSVNFIDYDGTIIKSYTTEEWNNVTTLPDNPSHDGLISQGWNWTKEQIDAQLANVGGDVWVGQMYITTSGDTEIDVSFVDSARLSPYLSCAVNGTITIDWGDNSTSTVTGTSLNSRKNTQHIYASTGDYTITIHVESGSWAFYGTSTYTLLNKNSSTSTANRVYSSCVKNVRIGADTSIGSYAFSNCFSLVSVTIPSGVTNIVSSAFNNCFSLVSVTIPSNVTSIGSSTFSYCYSLTSIAIPSNATNIGGNAFNNCYSLTSVTIPSGVTSILGSVFNNCYSIVSITIPSNITSIGSNAFYNCYSLASVTISSNVTSIGNSAFYNCYSLTSVIIPSGVTSIGGSVFYGCCSLASVTIPSNVMSIGGNAFCTCYSLASVTVPSGVTSIESSAFNNCCGMAEYHIKPTTPPTLGTTAFYNIQSDCIIYVPQGSLEAYQTATNWSTYASYMREE